jgi:hypothetical protein
MPILIENLSIWPIAIIALIMTFLASIADIASEAFIIEIFSEKNRSKGASC